jgi:hypothetical protein
MRSFSKGKSRLHNPPRNRFQRSMPRFTALAATFAWRLSKQVEFVSSTGFAEHHKAAPVNLTPRAWTFADSPLHSPAPTARQARHSALPQSRYRSRTAIYQATASQSLLIAAFPFSKSIGFHPAIFVRRSSVAFGEHRQVGRRCPAIHSVAWRATGQIYCFPGSASCAQPDALNPVITTAIINHLNAVFGMVRVLWRFAYYRICWDQDVDPNQCCPPATTI